MRAAHDGPASAEALPLRMALDLASGGTRIAAGARADLVVASQLSGDVRVLRGSYTDTITLADSATYSLTIAGAGEDAAAPAGREGVQGRVVRRRKGEGLVVVEVDVEVVQLVEAAQLHALLDRLD